ncbi:hypothetical protein OF83DRAFT_1179383 [Amylostereum chailletii]|nr:hypothetical protein OF83DRAFT_1179383 [Amylostereum chailletii]
MLDTPIHLRTMRPRAHARRAQPLPLNTPTHATCWPARAHRARSFALNTRAHARRARPSAPSLNASLHDPRPLFLPPPRCGPSCLPALNAAPTVPATPPYPLHPHADCMPST